MLKRYNYYVIIKKWFKFAFKNDIHMKKRLLSSMFSGNLLQMGLYGLMFMVMTFGMAACDSKSDSEEPQTEDPWPPQNFKATEGSNQFFGEWELIEEVNSEGNAEVYQGDPIVISFQDKGIWHFQGVKALEGLGKDYAWYSFDKEIVKLYMPNSLLGCENYRYEFNTDGTELKLYYQGNDYVVVERHNRASYYKKVK